MTTPEPACFFERESADAFRATRLVGGAWNPDEQHIAPALGLIGHAIETDLRRRRGDEPLRLARVSYDILGVIPIGVVTLEVGVLRPGRTIELVEARLSHEGRPAVLARAWLLKDYDTRAIAGTALSPMPGPDAMPAHTFDGTWGGACISTLETRREPIAQGRARGWLRTDVALVGGEVVSPTARTLGRVDFANGIVPRLGPEAALFPNVDLTVHLLREPAGEWLGFDTAASFGPGGIGLTHSILHDEAGPLGSLAQSLTVRPR
ncbi:thioesterase family protein [Aureimonas flava]|uniref:Thioesterase family protein n=1 Tax=Aureimonas flava TaxID=2320271 RepID=A0A3A1WJ04_9HYPH|nr:thioesterase family protein [Aureimonas flava]RIX99653.1 thioesterase family protein [Aureimonas flava]